MMQGALPGARRRGRPRTAWIDKIKTWTGLSAEESVRMTEDRDKWRKYVQPSDNRGRLKNRTETRACKCDESTSCRRCRRAACAGAPLCGSYRRLLASRRAARQEIGGKNFLENRDVCVSRLHVSKPNVSSGSLENKRLGPVWMPEFCSRPPASGQNCAGLGLGLKGLGPDLQNILR